MSDFTPKPRWFHPTPDRLVLGLLAIAGLLWLSDHFGWPAWHKGYAVLVAVASMGLVFLLMLVWFAISMVVRLRYQFSLRSLLALVVAVAIPCSWLTVEMRRAKRQRGAAEAIKALGGEVIWDRQSGPAWLGRVLGDGFFSSVSSVASTGATDGDLKNLRDLRDLEELYFNFARITDAAMEHLQGLSQLERLSLSSTPVTDAGLEHLKGLSQLRELDLMGTKVSDAGLKHLRGLSQLQRMSLTSTQVSDVGLEHLQGLSQLERLSLFRTKVSDGGTGRVRAQLPNCTIDMLDPWAPE